MASPGEDQGQRRWPGTETPSTGSGLRRHEPKCSCSGNTPATEPRQGLAVWPLLKSSSHGKGGAGPHFELLLNSFYLGLNLLNSLIQPTNLPEGRCAPDPDNTHKLAPMSVCGQAVQSFRKLSFHRGSESRLSVPWGLCILP